MIFSFGVQTIDDKHQISPICGLLSVYKSFKRQTELDSLLFSYQLIHTASEITFL